MNILYVSRYAIYEGVPHAGGNTVLYYMRSLAKNPKNDVRIVSFVSGYLCIVVTNQPVIARGEVTRTELDDIHNKMETLLGYEGAYVDAIYYCPHHPHKGYEGEIKELKIDCDCRKPKPGMLLRAAEDYNIDLNNSWMIGDSENDVIAGKTAGCRTVLVNGKGTAGVTGDFGQTFTVDSVTEACNKILEL